MLCAEKCVLDNETIVSPRHIPFDALIFIKSVAVLSVILVHLPLFETFYGSVLYVFNQGVMLFLLVQVFIVCMKLQNGERTLLSYYSLRSIRQVALRCVLPWILLVAVEYFCGFRYPGKALFLLNAGAFGPGSYYLWIYLFVYLLTPVFYGVLHRLNVWCILFAGIAVSYVFEYGTAWALDGHRLAAQIYRSWGGRYVFLIVLGLLAARIYGTPAGAFSVFKKVLGICVAVSCALVFLLVLGETGHLLPIPCDQWEWHTSHWCYYFFSFGLFWILFRYAPGLSGNHVPFLKKRLIDLVLFTGKHTWIIFLVQMFWFSMCSRENWVPEGTAELWLFSACAFAGILVLSRLIVIIFGSIKQLTGGSLK